MTYIFLYEGSPRVEGDDDEEDVDDLEHEFNIEAEKEKGKHVVDALFYGKMSYGRGPEDEEGPHFAPIMTNPRSRPVSTCHELFCLQRMFIPSKRIFFLMICSSQCHYNIYMYVRITGEWRDPSIQPSTGRTNVTVLYSS